jgi:chromosome partitioning protein
MRVCVAARKGGVGKSSVVAGLASLLAADGRRVLAVDLDPQSNLAFMLGVSPTAPGTAQLLGGLRPAPLCAWPNLDVLPGGPELARQDIARLDPEDLGDALRGFDYDDILFDCPPGSEHLERLGVVASHKALVITNAHPIAVVGASRVLDDLQVRRDKGRKGPGSWALVLNMLDVRRSLDRDVEVMLGSVEASVPRFRIKQDAQLAMATAQGTPLAELSSSPAVQALQAVKEWCLG